MSYRDCEIAFAKELKKTVKHIINEQADLPESEKSQLIENLSFAVAAHVSGSSFCGTVEGEEVYPSLSFWLGDGEKSEYFEDASALPELITNAEN